MTHARTIEGRLKAIAAPWDEVRQQAVELFAALLAPTALMAAALAIWRIGSDMSWSGEFPIEQGLFSHWQVWMSLGILMEIASYHLKRLKARR